MPYVIVLVLIAVTKTGGDRLRSKNVLNVREILRFIFGHKKSSMNNQAEHDNSDQFSLLSSQTLPVSYHKEHNEYKKFPKN